MLQECLASLVEGRHLTSERMQSALGAIMAGQCTEVEVAAFLAALRVKGETAEELAAGARLLRDQAAPLNVGSLDVLDTCGTGGDGAGTFNVSTAAALLAAACGIPVVKHGNRAVSSASGSADVLVALGIPIDLTPAELSETLSRTGFAFCFAPRFHPAMKHVANVRRALRFRTLFNLLGPLANPARPSFQVLGVGKPDLLDRMADALGRLGVRRAFVVHAEDGLDEVSLGAATHVRLVTPDGRHALTWRPEDFGLGRVAATDLRVAGPEESAQHVRAIFAGQPGPWRDTAVANAAVGLLATGRATALGDAVASAQAAIDDGRAAALLRQLTSMKPAAGRTPGG